MVQFRKMFVIDPPECADVAKVRLPTHDEVVNLFMLRGLQADRITPLFKTDRDISEQVSVIRLTPVPGQEAVMMPH